MGPKKSLFNFGAKADPFNLARFEKAQKDKYDAALAEIKNGKKVTHWMWFIFPQFVGIFTSEQSKKYAIKSLDEARAYLENETLGM